MWLENIIDDFSWLFNSSDVAVRDGIVDVNDGSWNIEFVVHSWDVNDGELVSGGTKTISFSVSLIDPSFWELCEFITWNVGIDEFWNIVAGEEKNGADTEGLEKDTSWFVDVKVGDWWLILFENSVEVLKLFSFNCDCSLTCFASTTWLITDSGSSCLIIEDWDVKTGGLITWGTWVADA